MATVGFIGLGLVGQALARRLLDKGLACIGYDVQSNACAAFAALGGRASASATAVLEQADTVIFAVYETQDLLNIVNAGAPDKWRAKLLIDCSTGDPTQLEALAQRLHAQGIDFLEAPLSGSSTQIAAGEATMLLGGAPEVIAAHHALLDALAPRRIHVGSTGMGSRAKLATNLLLGLNRAALAESMAFAEQLGIAPAQFLSIVLNSPARSAAAEIKGPMMANAQSDADFAPQSRIRQHLKDLELMLAQASALPLTNAHAQVLRAAVAAGDGELDNAAVIKQMRRQIKRG